MNDNEIKAAASPTKNELKADVAKAKQNLRDFRAKNKKVAMKVPLDEAESGSLFSRAKKKKAERNGPADGKDKKDYVIRYAYKPEVQAEYDRLVDEVKQAKYRLSLYGVTYDPELPEKKILLSVRNLKQFFGAGPYKTKAVHGISFDVHEGECLGLVGESGCGKTTTGRTVIGLYAPTSGDIYYKGYRLAAGDRWYRKEIKWSNIRTAKEIKALRAENTPEAEAKIAELQERNRANVAEAKAAIKQIRFDNNHSNPRLRNEIQMIFQDPIDSLDPRMTVEDIITEGLHIQGKYNRRENHKAVVEALVKVGLIPDFAARYPHEFSGGQRQRIGIARALVMNPKLLICDEPISALDVSIRAQILNLLNEIKENMNLTMLFIAHDLSVVKYFCDRIAVMYFGDMVELATSDELFRHPLHPYTKALLSAIPKPDPKSEKNRTRTVYDPSKTHDYSQGRPTFRELLPGHFVLCDDKEEAEYRKEIAALDQANEEAKQ